jgi:hypothetical protein
VWTAVINVKFALTVALPSLVMLVRAETKRVESYDFGFPAQEYLGVTLGVDVTADETVAPEALAARGARLSAWIEALRQRLEADPEVAGVTVVDRLPGEHHAYRRVELAVPGSTPSWVATAWIHPSYFDVMGAPVRTGRAFTIADRSRDSRVVIVDQAFVDSVMVGRNPIGHRVRLASSAQLDSSTAQLPWYEIIGVVKDLGMSPLAMPQRWPGMYLPYVPGSQGSAEMIVHARGDPMSLAPRVRELATTVDASLQVEKVTRLDQVAAPLLWLQRLWTRIIIGLTGVALLLSLSGIYAVLSYIVARRTREIGVRVALGASARRVITSIFRRPLTQVTLGVIAGAVLIGFAAVGVAKTEQFKGTGIGGLTLGDIPLLVGYAILMLGVCTLACFVPTRRALRVQPTEALRTE